MEGTVKKHIGIVVCLNGSDDNDIHNNHLVIFKIDKGSIGSFERSGYLQIFVNSYSRR